MSLQGYTVFITGASSGNSRGIGHAIALRCAREGANVAIAAKTASPHPKLPGTIHSAAAEVERAGGRALALVVDVRDESAVERALADTHAAFGSVDIVVNNASAIALVGPEALPMKTYDLMHSVNGRGTYLTSAKALPYLKESAKQGRKPHILNISPPLDMQPKWFAAHPAYTIAKYNMSMVALGLAAGYADEGISVNCLWPRTGIATAAIGMLLGDEGMATSRSPDIMAEAAFEIFQSSKSGEYLIDDAVLLDAGWTADDLVRFNPRGDPRLTRQLQPDFFLDNVPQWLETLYAQQTPSAKL